MTHHVSEPNADVARVSYLAIRQPAVIRMLEARLGGGDGDALAAGLELACRILEQSELADGTPPARIDHALIERGIAAVESGACDGGLTGWVARQLDELPIVLSPGEQRRAATAVAALLWALAERAGGDGDDVLA